MRQIERAPPFFIACGSNDFPHLIPQAAAFASALREQGGHVEHVVMPERTHFTASFAGGEADGPWVPPALAFMAKVAAG